MILAKKNKLSSSYYYIIIGLILKEAAHIFFSIEIIYFSLSVVSLCLVVYGFIIGRRSLMVFNGLQQLLFSVLLFLYLITILRGYISNSVYPPWVSTLGALNVQLANPKFLICYFIPLLVLNKWGNFNFKIIEKAGYYFAFISIVLTPFLIYMGYTSSFENRQISNFGVNDSVAGNFFVFLLLYRYIPKKHFIIYTIAWFLSLISTIVFARRGGVALHLLLFIFFFIVFFISSKGYKKVLGVIVVLLFIIGIFLIYKDNNPIFSYLNDRGLENTRSGVDAAVLSQLNEYELIFGKGIYGRYYLPIDGDMFFNGWRYEVETGFLQIVLRGGYLMAVIYVLVLLIPAIKGVFQSRNTFCKAGGLYIIYGLLSLIPYGVPEFNMKFFMFWILAVLCYSKPIRYMNDDMIKKKFF